MTGFVNIFAKRLLDPVQNNNIYTKDQVFCYLASY